MQTTDADDKTTFWIYSQSGQVLYTSEARRSQNLSYIYLGNTQVATRAVAWGTGTETIRYQHTDALGSPVAETDAAGNVTKRNSYAPYGEAYGTTSIDGTGYTGHVMDRDTGLTYMQQRYYDPQVGRFLSVDPMASDMNTAWNFNRYNYAANNPYRFTDPDGRQSADFNCTNCDVYAAQARSAQSAMDHGDMASAMDAVGAGQSQQLESPIGGSGVDVVLGGVEFVSGATTLVAASVSFLISASATDDISTTAPEVVAVAAAAALTKDGANRFMNGLDGGNRRTAYGEVGEVLFGPPGGDAGDLVSSVAGATGAAGSVVAATKSDKLSDSLKAAAAVSAVERDLKPENEQ